jgi:transcription initiation factor TFIIH subunit 3
MGRRTSEVRVLTSEDHPTLLAVIVDIHPIAWSQLQEKISLREALADILVYINAHLSLNNSNGAVVLAAHPRGARFLYPKTDNKEVPQKAAQGQVMYGQFREVNDAVLRNFEAVLDEPLDAWTSKGSAVSGALSLALAYINRARETEDTEVPSSGRILLLSVSGELASQYIPTMNAIFAAQKMVSCICLRK